MYRVPPESERGRQRALAKRLETLADRLERTDRRQCQLANALKGLARESNVSIGCACSRCERSYLLIKKGTMYCPQCGFRRSL